MLDNEFSKKIQNWLESEYLNIKVVNDERNPGPLFEFEYLPGMSMAIGFRNDKKDSCVIIRTINISPTHIEAIKELDKTMKNQYRFDFNYEFSSYGVAVNSFYDQENILKSIQFQKVIHDDGLNKMNFTQSIFEVFNAGFRAINYINKELN